MSSIKGSTADRAKDVWTIHDMMISVREINRGGRYREYIRG